MRGHEIQEGEGSAEFCFWHYEIIDIKKEGD
jgi:hypothetical protein